MREETTSDENGRRKSRNDNEKEEICVKYMRIVDWRVLADRCIYSIIRNSRIRCFRFPSDWPALLKFCTASTFSRTIDVLATNGKALMDRKMSPIPEQRSDHLV
jgi:hypothetical protein